MTRYDCEICRGNGLVRLPIHRRVTAFSADAIPQMVANSRDYPCPECGDAVTIGQVQALRKGPNDSREMRFQMVATVGVVHPSKLDTLEARIAERQDVVAKEVADEAEHQIERWADYGHSKIFKRDARHMIRDAFQIVMKRRSKVGAA